MRVLCRRIPKRSEKKEEKGKFVPKSRHEKKREKKGKVDESRRQYPQARRLTGTGRLRRYAAEKKCSGCCLKKETVAGCGAALQCWCGRRRRSEIFQHPPANVRRQKGTELDPLQVEIGGECLPTVSPENPAGSGDPEI